MDGIFALSALHLARYNPERRETLVAQAARYHATSIAKALPLITSVTPQNCNGLFIFGLLTLYFNLARPRQGDDILVVENGMIPEWLYLLRGTDTLVQAESAILSSAVSMIFRSTTASLDFWMTHSPQNHEALAELEDRIREHTVNDPTKQTILVEVIERLKRSYTFLYGRDFRDHEKMRGVYQWLFEISDGYLRLLKNADSEALCVLAYYSVLMRELDKYWWIEGWAVHLIRRIYILLDDEYRLWIRWPIEEIGWVPETPVR